MDESLSGKTFVVTGATSGIGLAVAEQLAQRGANLMGVGRSVERCLQAEKHLQTLSPTSRVAYCLADLSLQSQVRVLAVDIQQKLIDWNHPYLDGLINNAGTFTYWMALTPEGFETQWAVNHLAPFLLTHELLPVLQAAPTARVVTVSSGSHYRTRLNWEDIQLRKRYNGLLAYQQTKLANVLFSAELNRRLGTGSSVKAFVADPGLVKTDLGFKGTPALVRWFWNLRRSGGVMTDFSASGIVFLVCEPTIHQSPQIYWKDGLPKVPSRFAQDPQAARRLWAISEQMCGFQTGEA